MDARKVEVSAVPGSVDVEKVEYFAVGHVTVPVQFGARILRYIIIIEFCHIICNYIVSDYLA